ncbi:hypothetical protein [Streptomyces sp. SAS_270]|uniref:hypothetical protein n=1 Tax=Streptomyces sp. SAS_270 TaxID=3412748 RepID=UPI00403C9C49
MHGHGYAQPVKQPPATGWLVFVRVLLVVISVFTLGLLAWIMILRLAIVTRKSLDWGLLVAAIAADVLSLVLMGTEPGDEIHTTGGWLGLALLFGTLVAAISYYLAAEIRHFHQLRFPAYAPQPAYGYPAPQPSPSPYTATTAPQHPMTPLAPMPQATQTPMPHTPVPQPPPQRPAPARIDQVRAELDELSDYLRKQDGHHDGQHEGGR